MNAKTMKVGGGADYAKVAERLRLFREACPNGSITTKYEMLDGGVVFTALIVKDKKDPASAEATGNAYGELKTPKAFEKLESISIGRALAVLGYLASGEIASSDEMEEFYAQRAEKIKEEYQDKLMAVKDLNELKTVWAALPAEVKTSFLSLKDELKKKFEVANDNS